MTTCFLAPDPIQSTQFIPGGNTPANGGQLFFYAAGSTTKQTAYKDNAANSSWSNPLVLDSGGNLPSGGEVWFPTGQTFKVVFAPSNDTDPPTSPYWTKDNLAGMNDVSASSSDWLTGPTPTFVSGTSFTLAGDQTLTFKKGRRIKTTNSGGTVYSTITSSSFSVLTTITVVNDGTGVLDSGLSAVFYGLIDPQYSSINDYYVDKLATAVASAGNGTTNIWGINGNYVHVTGTNSIFNFSSAAYAGDVRTVVFDNALILSSSAAITMPANLNITTAANDRAVVYADTVSTAIVTYYPQSALPLALNSSSLTGSFAGTFLVTSVTVGASVTSAVILGANIDFTLFNEYQVHFYKVLPDSTGQIFQGQLSTSGAVNFNTGNEYQCAILGTDSAGSSSNTCTTNIATLRMSETGSGLNNAKGTGYSGIMTMYQPSASAAIKIFAIEGNYFNAGSQLVTMRGTASWTQAAALGTGAGAYNAIKFFMSGANISTGAFYLYALRKS